MERKKWQLCENKRIDIIICFQALYQKSEKRPQMLDFEKSLLNNNYR
jgi:hypothetical protein